MNAPAVNRKDSDMSEDLEAEKDIEELKARIGPIDALADDDSVFYPHSPFVIDLSKGTEGEVRKLVEDVERKATGEGFWSGEEIIRTMKIDDKSIEFGIQKFAKGWGKVLTGTKSLSPSG